jgi:DNA-directed RNA polymerase subunit RPC12/RpoP
MNRFKCPACGGNQYTSADTADGCIYCGHKELSKMETLEPEPENVRGQNGEKEVYNKRHEHRRENSRDSSG